VDFALTPTKPDKQWKRALELGARCTLTLAGTTGAEDTVRVKEVATRTEMVLDPAAAIAAVQAAGRQVR
jgi:histidyl-tRNA synthetase